MSDERWQRLKRIFHDALEQTADARGAFLDRECAGDADLRAEVEALLASHDEADGFLSRPAVEDALRAPPPTLEGRRIGAYRILGEIGRGGMGVVYQLRSSRSVGAARTRQLQLAVEWMRKAEKNLDELHAQQRLPMGSTEELEMVRRRIAECEAALATLDAPAVGPAR